MTLDYNKYLHTLPHLGDTHYIQVRVTHSFHCLPWLSSVVSVIFLLLVSFFLNCPWGWVDAPLPPASCRFYPTPVLPPTGCPLFPPFPTLSQVKIFGWFFVLPSPLLFMVSCLSFLFFSRSAAFSFFSFALSSAFFLYSSFRLLAFFLLLTPCPLPVSAVGHTFQKICNFP